MFYLYHSKMPLKKKCAALYLQPKKNWASDGVWYEDCAMGVNSLRDTVKNMCKAVGFKGNFTNHSLRSMSATRMYESGVEEQVIAEITGHRSLCVHSYKRTSISQKHKAAEALCSLSAKKTCNWTDISSVSMRNHSSLRIINSHFARKFVH